MSILIIFVSLKAGIYYDFRYRLCGAEYMHEITLKRYVELAKILKDKHEKRAPT